MGNLTLNGATSGQITLAPTAVAGTNTITLPAATGTVLTTAGGQTISGNTTVSGTVVMGSSFLRNRIINGAMVIDQRNAGASLTPSNGTYNVDRWLTNLTQSSKFSIQQNAGSVTPPTGFSNYLGVTSLSAYSVLSGDTFLLEQDIEGFNFYDFNFGSASAKTLTISFYVYSSLTGTFGGAIANSAGTRSYPFSYSIASANTWTQISITIPGDTTGTWIGATNGIGLRVRFGLGSGSTYTGTANVWAASNLVQPTGTTSVVGTNGATFYITGVQLEIGTAATPFEYRNYQQELAMCQRYFQIAGSGGYGSFDNSTTTIQMTEKLIIPMRTQPTGAIRSGVTAAFRSSGSDFTTASPALANFTTNPSAIGDGIAFWTQVTGFTGGTLNAVANSRNNQVTNGGAFINLSAEL